MLHDDGTIPPNLRRVPDNPHWRGFNGAQVSKANRAANSLAATAAENAASGQCAGLTGDTDSPKTAPSTALAVVLVNSEPIAQGTQTDLYRSAAQCWDRVKQNERDTWEHYVVIGKAMVAARAEIMRKLRRNDPTGPAYQREFKAWLIEYRLIEMDKSARARLVELIDASPEVNEMLSGWSDEDRRKRNHPNTIHRALEKWRVEHGRPTETRTRKQTGTSRDERLHENDRLRAHIGDIEGAFESDTASAATPTEPLESPIIKIEANGSPGIEIVSSSRKKMTPSAARRAVERAERKRHVRLERTVFQISCACEDNEEMELPTLTAAEREGAVAKLEASASDLKKLIGRLEAAPITERDPQHD